MNKTILSIKNICKTFGNVTAVDNFSLNIHEGEFITILGPSGCGKTTLLRIIAGLESSDSGEVLLEDKNLSEFPPEKRDINTVFQNYALFPHMNVFDNVAYGLKLRKIDKNTINKKVLEALRLVQLEGFEKRKINQLSGGQKQRVAIARAIILEPKVLLLDEPLGALDYKLRVSMQNELKKMQKALNTTFIYITHDQDEALNLSDRIVLMSNAHIEQIGTPDEIYKKPATLFAARFIGEPNIIKGKHLTDKYDFKICICDSKFDNLGDVYAIVRPESVYISDSGVNATVISQTIMGGIVKTEFELDDNTTVYMHGFDTPNLSVGENVFLSCKSEDVHYITEKGRV